ncbi:hypothetical protein [Cohnella rhizosphaerae]|uniref:Helicase XPB/Ssl2 N-terminal domain-containing protein n=1 Tax=Cohnella rhizosphaerae TaxID=1457232 RepID=A0A9X4KYZ7_9BACL|nr:hypothetical protein [Cohnella rhizosphaerae]MDG0813083.1 hypothetical protein [Cohnella rhizosphaerae]
MNLADMLSYADIAQLSGIAEVYQCECSSHSKNELIQSILSAVQRREVLARRVEEMSVGDLRFLNSLLFEKRASYSLEDLTARAALAADHAPAQAGETGQRAQSGASKTNGAAADKGIGAKKTPAGGRKKAKQPAEPASPADERRSAIARFKRYGWLFGGITQQTRYLFHVPEDVKKRLCDAIEAQFRGGVEFRDEPPAYRDERGLMAKDLERMLKFVRDHDMPLTAEGYLYKRQLQQLLDVFSVMEQAPAKTAFRFGYGRRFKEYPERFSLLYDYAYCCGLLLEQEGELRLSDRGREMADGKETCDPADLYRFWLRLYKLPVPNLQALAQWIMRLSRHAWVTVDSLGATLLPLVKPYYYDSEKSVFEQRTLAMMLHLGLLRLGETAEGEAVVTMTPQGVLLVAGSEIGFEDALPWSYGVM